MKKHNEYTLIGLAAMRRAAKQARELAALHGLEIPVWEEGRIVYERPKARPRKPRRRRSAQREG